MRTLWCLLLMAGCAGSTGGNMDGVDAAVADVRGEARDGAPEEELGAGADLPPPVEYRPVVFAVVTDIHLGGGYETPQTQNVLALFEEAAAMSPAPELLVVTGDLVDAVPEPVDTGAGGRVDALRRLFREGPLPVEAVAGNHDYYSAEFPVLTLTGDRAARDAMWDAELAMPRWQVTEHGGTRFIYVNTMQGDLWDISKGLNGSAGREQLEWLDGLLSEDRPAVLFMHHPPSTVLEAGDLTVEAVIAAHPDTVLAVFAGHLHMWARSEYEGVPIYLTEAGWDGEGIHHVRVDPEARTVEILNEDDIDYGEMVVHTCDPAAETPVGDLSVLEGALLELIVTDATAEPAGFGTYLEEAVTMAPMVLQLGAPDPSGLALPARLAAGVFQGEGTPSMPPFVAPLEDGPCLATGFAVDDPCAASAPVTLTLDLAQFIGFQLGEGWRIRVDLSDLTLEGVLTSPPGLAKGVLSTVVDLEPGVQDLQGILVAEYCAGNIAECPPGADDLPACPREPDWTFFDAIPVACDVSVYGIGVRMVLTMLDTVPGHVATLDANFVTWAASEGTSGAGNLHPDVFGATCED